METTAAQQGSPGARAAVFWVWELAQEHIAALAVIATLGNGATAVIAGNAQRGCTQETVLLIA